MPADGAQREPAGLEMRQLIGGQFSAGSDTALHQP
jgi:hypothetical protein